MNAPMPRSLPTERADPPERFGLLVRLGVIVGVLAVEVLLISSLIQSAPLESLVGAARVVHAIQHLVFRFLIAYVASLALLTYLRGSDTVAAISATARDAPIRVQWFVIHALLLLPLGVLSVQLYRTASNSSFAAVATAWHLSGLAAALSLFAAAAPLAVWRRALCQTGGVRLFALAPASVAVIAIKTSQQFWTPAAAFTFRLVRFSLRPLYPSLQGDAATLTLYTGRFAVTVSEACSGLEGVGLMLAFCSAWLFYFRREYAFPRALVILPIAAALAFLLNAARIAALVAIGDAGYVRIATVGFHSQAGWILFNLTAIGVAGFARQSRWLHRANTALDDTGLMAGAGNSAEKGAAAGNPAAPYLMPLLAILAAGMTAHALSEGMELLYPLRLTCGVIALYAYRRRYMGLDWSWSWRGVAAGFSVFCIWMVFARLLTAPSGVPDELMRLPSLLRGGWIICRVTAAIVTVPLAEELAYRGFLMRRIVAENFESVALQSVRWTAIAISAIAFGITHGHLWLAGIIAGLAYGVLAAKTGKMGECVIAHATTNAFLAAYVILFGQWQLW